MTLVRLNAGFHGGAGNNALNGWTNWWETQHNAGLPVNAIFADNAGPLYEIQQSNFSGDVLIYRRSLWHNGFDPNSPDYTKRPEDEAVRMLSYKYTNLFPPELDKYKIWLKDTNEIRTQTNPGDVWYGEPYPLQAGEWWGRYGLAAAQWAVERNYKVVLLSPSSGDHTTLFWEQPSMLQFLAYAAAHKDNVIVGLHEYSYVSDNLFALPGNDAATIDDLLTAAPESRRVGRFELLLDILDKHNIDWPLLYMCEWGWSERNIPDTENAMSQIVTLFTRLYGAYRNYIVGWGTWYLGPGFGETIQIKTNSLLMPCAYHAVNNQYDIVQREPQGEPIMGDCDAITDVRTISLWIPQYDKMTSEELSEAYSWARYGFEDNNGVKTPGNHMLCPSHVDALRIHTQGLPGSILGVAYPEKIGSGVTEQWIRTNCPCAYEDNKQVVFLPKKNSDCIECLPLNITYSQRDSRWAADVLGQNTGHDKTIGNYGCLMTAYNMQAVFLGLTTDTPKQFNTRMKNAGAFSGPYLNPGALATTFPTQIQYNGYLSRGETLNNRIKSYIDVGYPVPVEVDFKPETSQWDQHWVLVIGYSADDFYIVDPWHGDKLWLSNRYNISGNDILQGVFYTKKATTPGYVYNGPAVTFRPLIESPADDWRWPVVKSMIDYVNIGVKFKSHGSNADYYTQYSGRHDFLPVRLFFSATDYVTPEILYRDTWKGQIQNFYNRGARDFELFNEPNIEGVGIFWNNGTEFANYMKPICNWMQADFPGIRIWFTAMSPGVPFTNQYTWIDAAWPILAPYCYGFCTHAYSGDNVSVTGAVNDIVNQINVTRTRYNLQKPLFLSECSVNRGTNYFQKAQVYRGLEQQFNTMRGIKAVSYFISDWYSPPPEQQGHGESWYGTTQPQHYVSLG